MNLRARLCGAVLVLGLLSAMSSSAHAQWGGWGGGYLGSFGLPYNAYVLDAPPYFSIYPPVYYSHPVPRPYGFSPFAYPPGVMTPDRLAMPSTPFTPRARRQVTKPAQVRTAAAPLMIKNPFVMPEADRPAKLADGRAAPKMVYPTAVASTR